MQHKISVIVPVYNVCQYLDKCISSICSQTHSNIEVILINDGSTDESQSIMAKYQSDRRVVCIHQDNAGVSPARNRGIETATGDYIGFVDSDDYIEKKMFEKLLSALLSADADMSVCNYNLVYDKNVVYKYTKMQNETADVYQDVYGYFSKHCARPKPNNYIWTRLYKADIIRNSNVRFENYRLADDTLFNFKLLPYIRKVAFVDDSFYNYVQRDNSNVYTVAKKCNLAREYADSFDSLLNHYKSNITFEPFLECMPLHAFTRLRSVYFYSRLAKMTEAEIAQSIESGFAGRTIDKYLTGFEE